MTFSQFKCFQWFRQTHKWRFTFTLQCPKLTIQRQVCFFSGQTRPGLVQLRQNGWSVGRATPHANSNNCPIQTDRRGPSLSFGIVLEKCDTSTHFMLAECRLKTMCFVSTCVGVCLSLAKCMSLHAQHGCSCNLHPWAEERRRMVLTNSMSRTA